MMFYRISRDDRGVAAVEMALVLPVLFLFIYGIFQIGALMAANAVMQSALGEGAREATIWPARTDTQIKTRIQSEVYNVYAGTFVVADPTTTSVTAVSGKAATGSSSAVTAVAGVKKTILKITYTVTPDMLFFTMPPVTITRTKTAYMPIEAAA